jgi:hypothetical protein
MLQEKLASQLGALDDDVHLIDGVPIPLCYLARASRCRSFADIADYGYCAAKDMHYYDFHGHVLISGSVVIGDHVVNGQKTTLRLKSFPNIDYRH